MSMFTNTMTKAITDYRQILRRYLPSQERTAKLKQLGLKNAKIFKSDILLYQTGQAIIEDIQENIRTPDEGYYSYHGITKFCDYLKEYLSDFEASDGVVVHKAQKAAKAMIKVIQVFAMDDARFNGETVKELKDCNQVVVLCGSDDQRHLYQSSLKRQCEYAPGFYGEILQHYEQLLSGQQ